MFEELRSDLLLLGPQDRIFLGLVAGSIALVLLAIALAGAVLVLHWRESRRAAAWAMTERRLEPVILQALSGDAPPEEVWAAVRPGEEYASVRYLLDRFARNLKGAELDRVREIALPMLGPIARDARDREPQVRARAIQMLATLGLERYEALIAESLADPSPAVVLVSMQALARRGDALHAPAILASLDRVRVWSPGFLSRILAWMGPEAVPHLAERYRDPGAAPEVRAICADALRQIGVPVVADVAAQVLGEMVELIAPPVDEGSDELTQPGRLTSGEVTAVGEEREIVLHSLRLLGDWGHSAHLPLLRRFARSPDPVVRSLGIAALGRIGGTADVPTLSAAIEDPSRWVAMHAAVGLRDLGALAALGQVADGPSERANLAKEVLLG